MKELSIEEKAKRYSEAIERAKSLIDFCSDSERKTLKYVFHELKESKDEQHRKWILDYLYNGLQKSDEQFKDQFKVAIAWLEKQSDKNEIINRDEFAQGVLRGAAINLITWIDYNAAEGNACLSNMECNDIEDALVSGNWDKIYAYIKKKLKKQSEYKPTDKMELQNERIDFIWSLVNQIVPNKELQTIEVKEFTDECVNMIELYAKKNHDYGNSFDEGCDKLGTGYPLGRLLDKMNRLIACIGKEDEMQVNESIEDTLTDLGCYSVMTLSYLKRKKNK